MTKAKIFFCGDPHGRFEHVVRAVKEYRPAAIVVLGDLEARRPLHQELEQITDLTEVWWIPGNHDTESETNYDNLFGSHLADRNLHGRVVEIAGIRIAGLGGVFRRQVWFPPDTPRYESASDFIARCGKGNLWRQGLPRKHRSSIFPEDYQRLLDEHADVLVSHEAPSFHPHGFREIDALAKHLGVTASLHGHHHDELNYRPFWSQAGYKSYGVGLCGILNQEGEAVCTYST